MEDTRYVTPVKQSFYLQRGRDPQSENYYSIK